MSVFVSGSGPVSREIYNPPAVMRGTRAWSVPVSKWRPSSGGSASGNDFFFCQSASSSRKTPGRERSEHAAAAVYYDDWKSSVNTWISAEKRRKSTVSFRTFSLLLVFPRVLFGI